MIAATKPATRQVIETPFGRACLADLERAGLVTLQRLSDQLRPNWPVVVVASLPGWQ